jgi:hypothetical protein
MRKTDATAEITQVEAKDGVAARFLAINGRGAGDLSGRQRVFAGFGASPAPSRAVPGSTVAERHLRATATPLMWARLKVNASAVK